MYVIYLKVKLICLEIPVHISLQSLNNANHNSFLVLFYDLLTQLAVISRKQTCHSRTPKGASFCPTFMFFATIIHTLALGPVLFTVSLKSYSFFHTHDLIHECERKNSSIGPKIQIQLCNFLEWTDATIFLKKQFQRILPWKS